MHRRFGNSMAAGSLAAGIILVMTFGVGVRAVRADGCFLPRSDKAIAALPKIPAQRAMIVWRDGAETLIVESALDSASQEVGWVLPLPAEPMRIEAMGPDLLESVAMTQGPALTHDLVDMVGLLVVVCVLELVICVYVVYRRTAIGSIILAGAFVVLLLVAFGAPSLGGGTGGSGAAGVVEMSGQRVGNYEVKVLAARDAGALDEWLRENGLRELGEAGRGIVEGYIRDGWVFAVAKLVREAGGAAVPHPIAATFAAAKPVYPMKLTALAESTTRVDLFVVGDRQATASGMTTVACDRYKWIAVDRMRREVQPYYSAEMIGMMIGSPDAKPLLWDGCVVTALAAEMSPAEMVRDVEIGWRALEPYREELYTAQARRHIAYIILLIGAVFLTPLGLAVLGLKSRKGWWLWLGTAAATVLAAGVTWSALPPADGYETISMGRVRVWSYTLEGAARVAVADGKVGTSATPEEWVAVIRKGLEKLQVNDTNPYTGRAVVWSRTPGNFTAITEGEGVLFCYYDEWGREQRTRMERMPPRRERP